MKALTVLQPFASLVLGGQKTIETRSWKTAYRGDILICAGRSPHRGTVILPLPNFPLMYCEDAIEKFPGLAIFGVSLCVVELVHCRPLRASDWVKACCFTPPNLFAWVLTNVRPVEMKPVRGQQRLFEVPDDEIEYLFKPHRPAKKEATP